MTSCKFVRLLAKLSQKFSNPLVVPNLFRKLGESGAPGMQPNFIKIVYYQGLLSRHFGKAVPINGPSHYLGFFVC